MHNTQETNFFEYGEWKPREYLCQWDPDQPKPSAYEVLKAIRRVRIDNGRAVPALESTTPLYDAGEHSHVLAVR